MTNAEKFKEVFGIKPDTDRCIIPYLVCREADHCNSCPFDNWWHRPYLPCFELKEEFDGGDDV